MLLQCTNGGGVVGGYFFNEEYLAVFYGLGFSVCCLLLLEPINCVTTENNPAA